MTSNKTSQAVEAWAEMLRMSKMSVPFPSKHTALAFVQKYQQMEAALEDMWDQFAYDAKGGSGFRGKYDGGLSALESCDDALAFDPLST